jgi:hypothetical protein
VDFGPCDLFVGMRRREHTVPLEARLLAWANDNFGLVRYEDLIRLGFSPGQITRRLASGRLTRLHDRVYAVGHVALRDEGRWLAALWACGPESALSHTSASASFGWSTEAPGDPVHVTTTRSIRSRPGIVVHRVRRLERIDVFHRPRLAVTTIPRTLVDLADVMDWSAYRTVADRQRHLRLDSLRQAQLRAPNRVGAPLVRRLLEADDAHTKSEFERRFLRFCTDHGLPRPDALNRRIAGHMADCVYRSLVIELDGRTYHDRRAQMRADRMRDADYQLAGLHILRLVWDDLHPGEAATTAVRVRAMLAL